jgi:hypothetical protein
MDKRRLHHQWTYIRLVRPWYFFIFMLACLIVGVFALRANNLKMVELRDAVYQADKDGGDTSKALTELQRHVTSHMNTGLSAGNTSVYPPIQLKYTYDRLREANAKTTNEQIYTEAQQHCEALNPTDFSGRNRVPCIQEYVESRGVQQKAVPDSLYKFDFVSPTWSPDLAGFSIVGAIFFGLLGAGFWLVDRWFKKRVA